MKIFVTGGTGFLGVRLVRQLLQQGHHVVCLVRPNADAAAFLCSLGTSAIGAGRCEIARGSLSHVEEFGDQVRTCDTVIHAAAAMTGGAPMLFSNNVIATRALLALIPGSSVKRFVLVSSLGVYAAGHLSKGAVLDETTALDPQPHRRDAYTYSKVMQERVAWAARDAVRLPLVVIRPGVIYGPGRGAMSSRVGLRVGRMLLRMGGRQHVPYTYVDNCAAAIVAAVTAQGVEGHAFNIIDDDLPTARAILKHHRRNVERLHVVPIPHWAIGAGSALCEWYHRWSRGQLPAVLTRYKSAAQWGRLRYTNKKAKGMLGWHPGVRFDEGLRLSVSSS